MYEVTRTYKVYPFNELPEKLKDKARALFRDDLVNQALNDAQDSIYWEYMPGEFGMEMNLKEGLYFDLFYNTVSFVANPVDYLTLYEEFLLPRMRGVAGAAHPVGREVYPAHHQGRVGMLHLED